MKQGVQRRIIKTIAKIPGVVESYLLVSDLLGQSPIFDSGWRHLSRWLAEANRFHGAESKAISQRILVFAVYPQIVDFSLAVTAALIGRTDASIDFVWSPRLSQFISPPESIGYPFWLRSTSGLKEKSLNPRLRVINLDDIRPANITPTMQEAASLSAEIDTSYVQQKERIQIESDPKDKAVYQHRYRKMLDTVSRVASHIDSDIPYDRVITCNGIVSEFGAVYNYLAQLGIPVSTWEMSDTKSKIFASSDLPVMNLDTERAWLQDQTHLLSPNRQKRVEELMIGRQNPNSSILTLAFQNSPLSSPENIRSALSLTNDKPIVLICPNVPFDAIYYAQQKQYFEGMWDWLQKTVRWLSQRRDCQVVIRSHPAEHLLRSRETAAEIIHNILPSLPKHINILPASIAINTYALMNIADVGLVYASTTGLEMAMRGIPVICGIKSHYNCKEFTIEPNTLEEYFAIIERVLRCPTAARLTPRQIELAWCYADIFFNQWRLPFPWSPSPRFWSELKEWPITRLLSSEGEAQYGRFFETLLGST